MKSKSFVLAIDQGTTGSTAILVDRSGKIKGKSYSEFTQHYPSPGWVEHDALEIWNVTMRIVKEVLSITGTEPSSVSSIGITNQRETCLLWDRKTGIPLSRAIVWQDRRTADFCRDLKGENNEPLWQKKTGLMIDPYFSGTKLHWMLSNLPDARKRAANGDIAFGTIDSWLVYKLTGGKQHITDSSNASRTLLFNLNTLDWDPDILHRLDIPAHILPKITPSSGLLGETDPQAFFGIATPIGGIAGDQQSALFGQSCFKEGMAKNTYGTGSFLLMNIGKKPVISKERLLTTVAWRIENEPTEYALEGSIFITGAAIQWLRDELGIIKNAAETEALAKSLNSNDGVYFVPALTGLGAPYWDPYARGVLIGLTRGTSRAHIARAALESIAYQTNDVMSAMARESGKALSELRVDGGGSANNFLMQFQSDILGVPVKVPSITETTALGAAFLAGLSANFWKDRAELAALWKERTAFTPQIPAELRKKLLHKWKKAVERSMNWSEN